VIDFLNALKFLYPHFTDPLLAWLFFFIIIFVAVSTALSVKQFATIKSWEKNWNNGRDDQSESIDVDYVTLADISHSVETKSEKIAEIIPGVLLIIGLLGTFMGLGIALDSASSILNSTAQGGVNQAMGELTHVLAGLGTKFKTSTWGILAFLIFKFWHSRSGFEEKRLAWCISRISKELAKRKTAENNIQAARDQKTAQLSQQHLEAHLQAIKLMGDSVCTTLKMMNESDVDRHNNLLIQQKNQNEILIKSIDDLKEGSQNSGNSISTAIKIMQESNFDRHNDHLEQQRKQHEILIEELASLNEESKKSGILFKNFVDGHKETANHLSNAAETMGGAAEKLNTGVGSFKSEVSELMTSLKDDLKFATDGISNAVNESSISMKQVTAEIANAVHDSSVSMKLATNGISQAVSDSSKSMDSSLEKMKANLQKATEGIAIAVKNFSNDMRKSVGSIIETNEKAELTQQKMLERFTTSTKTFIEGVEVIKNELSRAANATEQGLKAVSAANLRLKTFDTSLGDMTKEFDNAVTAIKAFPIELKKIVTSIQQRDTSRVETSSQKSITDVTTK
jgi:hypothetical protein